MTSPRPFTQTRAAGHPFHRILQAWLAGHVVIALSTEILLEYEEVITPPAPLDCGDSS